jgi:lipoprotein-releasing system permease protein
MAKGRAANTESVAPAFAGWERSIAARYLRTKRKNGGVALISGIAFVGIMLAVAVLIIVMSVMNGFRTELTGRMLGFNGHAYVSGPAINGPERDAMISRLRQVPGVVQVAPIVEAQTIVIGPSQVVGGIVRGMRPGDVADTKIIATNMRQGSLDGFGKGDYGGDLVLLGSRLAEAVGVHVGDTVTLVSPQGADTAFGSSPRRKDYTVGGVFTVGLSDYDQAYVYMPLEQAQLFFGREGQSDRIEVNVKDPAKIPEMRPLFERAAGAGAAVTDWRDTNKSFFNALQVERATMRLILLMVVAISVMNIISGLIMLVKNKTRDIAILRTMGASQGAILRIFFMSGAWIGTAGALAGLVIGSLFCIFIDPIQTVVETVTGVQVFSPDTYFLSRIPARIEWLEVAIATGSAMLMSFVATLPTAWRASRIDPVEALRYE